MAGEWTETTWGGIATLEYGKALRAYSDVVARARVYGTNGPVGWHTEPLWPAPGVIIGRKGAYRGVHYSTVPYWVIDTAYSLQPKRGVRMDMRWSYYQIRHLDPNTIDDGSPIPSTTRPAFYAQPILLPPFEEQERIAELLGSLDNKIELNRRMAETLEAMARALFKSWFIDFDPVHAKAEGHATGLPDDLAALFPDSFGETGLPEGWRVSGLGALATLNPESWTRGTLPEFINYVDLANTKWGVIEATQEFAKHDAPSRAQRVLRPGDTIVGTVRPGNGSYAYIAKEGLTGSTSFAALRPRSRDFATVVYFASTGKDNITALAQLADGAAYPAVRPDVVSDTPVNMPPNATVLTAFNALASPMLASIQERTEQSRTLSDLRDTLLPKLISGELRIAEAEERIAAA